VQRALCHRAATEGSLRSICGLLIEHAAKNGSAGRNCCGGNGPTQSCSCLSAQPAMFRDNGWVCETLV
jgi:hypothetical protein